MEVPLQILAPLIVGAAALIVFVGIPTLMKLRKLRQIVESDGEVIED